MKATLIVLCLVQKAQEIAIQKTRLILEHLIAEIARATQLEIATKKKNPHYTGIFLQKNFRSIINL